MNRPVRVLLLLDSLAPAGGTENQLIEIVRRIDRTQVEMFVACMEDSQRLRDLAPYATPLVFPARGLFSLAGLRQALVLRRVIARHRIDVVHTFMVRATVFGVLGSAVSSCRAILTSRRNMGEWYTPRLLRLFKLVNRLSTRVLANSEGARANAIRVEHLPPDRVDVLYNGVDIDRFTRVPDPALRERLGIPPAAPVVGIVANLRPVKNLPLFLEAARIVAGQAPDTVFVLAGRGEQREQLARQAAGLGLAERVVFAADHLDEHDDIACLLPHFRIACLCSDNEGFSNAILEYMAAGLPVVATDVGGIAEAVEHGQTGLLVPSNDAAALAGAILELLRDPQRCAALGRNARRRCAERFEIQHAVRQWERYYRKIAEA